MTTREERNQNIAQLIGTSDKRKIANWKYNHSPKGYARWDKYEKSENGREKREAWRLSHPEYQSDRYHRLQDEMGYHGKPGEMYPGYRFLKALEEAEVIEIGRLENGKADK